MRLIDKDALIKKLCPSDNCSDCERLSGMFCSNAVNFVDVCKVVCEAPIVEEKKTGEWIGTEFDGYADGNPVYYEWECSACGYVVEDEEPTWRFCPNCGARMIYNIN